MDWLRKVITDYYDKLLRDKNRDQHHAGIRRGLPGLWQHHGAKDTQPRTNSAPAPKDKDRRGRSTPGRDRRDQSAAPATRKGRCPAIPEGRCKKFYVSGCCPRDKNCAHLIHERPNLPPRSGRKPSRTAAATPRRGSNSRTRRPRSAGSQGSQGSRKNSRSSNGSRKSNGSRRSSNGSKGSRRSGGSQGSRGSKGSRGSGKGKGRGRGRKRKQRRAAASPRPSTPRPKSKGKKSPRSVHACHEWAKNGTCSWGAKCKFSHEAPAVPSPRNKKKSPRSPSSGKKKGKK